MSENIDFFGKIFLVDIFQASSNWLCDLWCWRFVTLRQHDKNSVK